jgi:DNA-binding CsgD family transcriptional regulator
MAESPDISLSDFSDITTSLFSAAMGHCAWDDFLGVLSAKSGHVHTHLIAFDAEAGLSLDMAQSGYDPAFLQTYRDYYGSRNAWAPGFMAKPVGHVIDCEEMCPSSELVKTEFYHDWLRPQEDIIQGGGASLFRDDSRLIALGGNIRLRDAEALKAPWLRLVGHLIPHLRQAFDISRALAGARLETLAARDMGTGDVGTGDAPGVALLSPEGRVLIANRRIEAMLSEGDPLGVDPFGRIAPAGDPDIVGDGLRARLASPAASWTVSLPGAEGGPPWDLRFARFRAVRDLPEILQGAMALYGQTTLLVMSRRKAEEGPRPQLRARYGLTETEAEVVILLSEGLSGREVADRRGVSVNTVRNQVQSAMTKMDVRRRAELARLVLDAARQA